MFFLISIIVVIVAATLWFNFRKQARATGDPNIAKAGNIALMLILVFGLIGFSSVFTAIPAGHVGVVDFFGVVSDNTLKAGINIVNPLANVHKFSVKTQEIKEVMDVPSKEGLSVQLEVSVLFHLNPEKASQVYKTIGPNYINIILEPQFRSVVRGVTAAYEARALYTSEREMLAKQIKEELEKGVTARGIEIETTPLRRIGLPQGLTAAIEEKLRAEQESQRMQFTLMKERQEADRKRIEAQGIADFQAIISRGLNDQVLRWKGIEATEKLAGSANTKVVVIGGGKDGLPLILDTK